MSSTDRCFALPISLFMSRIPPFLPCGSAQPPPRLPARISSPPREVPSHIRGDLNLSQPGGEPGLLSPGSKSQEKKGKTRRMSFLSTPPYGNCGCGTPREGGPWLGILFWVLENPGLGARGTGEAVPGVAQGEFEAFPSRHPGVSPIPSSLLRGTEPWAAFSWDSLDELERIKTSGLIP